MPDIGRTSSSSQDDPPVHERNERRRTRAFRFPVSASIEGEDEGLLPFRSCPDLAAGRRYMDAGQPRFD